jgi:hypothetical protein
MVRTRSAQAGRPRSRDAPYLHGALDLRPALELETWPDADRVDGSTPPERIPPGLSPTLIRLGPDCLGLGLFAP